MNYDRLPGGRRSSAGTRKAERPKADNEEQLRMSDDFDIRDRAKSIGKTTQDVLMVALYVPGRRSFHGFAELNSGETGPFAWLETAGAKVEGGLVARGQEAQH